MFRERCITVNSPKEWRDALCGIQHSFAHTWENCYALQLTTGFNTYLYCFETDGVRIVCPIAERMIGEYIDIVTPYGFSGFVGNSDWPSFCTHWKEFAKDRGYVCGYFTLNPRFENCTYFHPADLYRCKTLYYLDLTQDVAEIFRRLDKNRKREVTNGKWNKREIIRDTGTLTKFLIAHYADFMASRTTAVTYWHQPESLACLAASPNVLMIGSSGSKGIDAVSVFGYTSNCAEYLVNISLPEGRACSASLVWHGAIELKKLGIPLLNLGGGVTENDGVAKFKERFGGDRVVFKCLKQIYDGAAYEMLCRQAGVEATTKTDYFPPYRCSSNLKSGPRAL